MRGQPRDAERVHAAPMKGLLAADHRIEILITDIQMSPIDGYEVAARARRMRPDLRIIFASGRGESRDDLPLIRKPFTCRDLAQLMERTTGLC